MNLDVVMFFAVPVIVFMVLLLPAALHYSLKRMRKARAEQEAAEPASPAKSNVTVEMQSIPLREITTLQAPQKAKPYVAIPAPFRISTSSTHSANIV